MQGAEPILSLKAVRKMFGPQAAVDSIDLDIAEGEFFTIVGPSGSGKTTMLRMLAGMDTPTSGDILLQGRAHQRRAGQQAADLHGVPVAGAVSPPHRGPEHRIPAEDQGRGAGATQGARTCS